MKKDTVEINGTDYRIEFNWNAVSNFLEDEGIEVEDLDKMGKLKPSQITKLIFHGIKEGARLQGKELPFTPLDLGAALNVQSIADILTIYRRQITPANVPPPDPQKKRRFFQKG